jgi:hypothetical protein
MLLTRTKLNLTLNNLRVSIPKGLEKELLDQYGKLVTDDEGHIFEFTEQDICEQLRKKLCP